MSISGLLFLITFPITVVAFLCSYLIRRRLKNEFNIDTVKKGASRRELKKMVESGAEENSEQYRLLKRVLIWRILQNAFLIDVIYIVLACFKLVPR